MCYKNEKFSFVLLILTQPENHIMWRPSELPPSLSPSDTYAHAVFLSSSTDCFVFHPNNRFTTSYMFYIVQWWLSIFGIDSNSFVRSLARSLKFAHLFFSHSVLSICGFWHRFESPFRFVQFSQLIMCIFTVAYHRIEDKKEKTTRRGKRKQRNIVTNW